jgi:hypothetical protein
LWMFCPRIGPTWTVSGVNRANCWRDWPKRKKRMPTRGKSVQPALDDEDAEQLSVGTFLALKIMSILY